MAHGAEFVGFSPASPQAHQPVYARIALQDHEQAFGRVYQDGNAIELFVGINDVVPVPPQGNRIESYLLGSLPAGTYRFRFYAGGPTQPLRFEGPLGVAAATPVPSLGALAMGLLALAVGGFGCVFFRAGLLRV